MQDFDKAALRSLKMIKEDLDSNLKLNLLD